ncbi:Nicotinamide riboside transporter PnuC [Polaribacter huanghezhanensis]|uniref:nicotinamide riboside transporter PnuC n=1 Tax=Polaribacter huanghezhanensis TaxID=1354726 RepID=UPI0026484DB1|nr:nicotinamide riboside transporter PnuC [Polaribacter huanghezhanensis]WKD85758.1 Nicotinamide riboside transporter PnuC [Polaribacter huanghezhanensis]
MSEIFDFFLEPYQTATFLNIFLEIVAASFGIISVFYAKKENILVFPTGIISTGIYVYLLSQWNLYGDLIINIYYTIMSLYGWYLWNKITDDKNHHIPISRTNNKDKLKAFGIFVFTAAFVLFIYGKYDVIDTQLGILESIKHVFLHLNSLENFRSVTPYIDTFTTASAFVAMWLMANKKIENWTFWIVTNIVSVPLYFVKGYGFTGIQYTIFLILAFQGYNAWKISLDNNQQTS